jgi:hypothetical protein
VSERSEWHVVRLASARSVALYSEVPLPVRRDDENGKNVNG